MVLDPKGARSRAMHTLPTEPDRSKTTDAEKAAKIYGGKSHSATGSPDPERFADADRSARQYAVENYGARPENPVIPNTIRLSNGTLVGQALLSVKHEVQYTRVKLNRDRNRPLEFDGRVLAEVYEPSHDGDVMLRAAIYETKGGKFIDELTRFEVEPGVDYGDTKPPYLFAKAEVFDSRDIAAMWFRTKGGRLTHRLMDQLGDVESEFVE